MNCFDGLPSSLQETVFSYVQKYDRFECAKVSRAWFHLTLKTYWSDDGDLSSLDRFLRHLVVFYNAHEADGFSHHWELLQLMSKVTLALSDENAQYVKQYARNVSKVFLFPPEALARLVPFVQTRLDDGNMVLAEDRSQNRKVTGMPVIYFFVVPTRGRSILFDSRAQPEWITEIEMHSVDFEDIADGLRLICQKLKGLVKVTITSFNLTRKMHKVFPPNITRIRLRVDEVEEDMQSLVRPGEQYGRNCMFFLCQNWRTLRSFRMSLLMVQPYFYSAELNIESFSVGRDSYAIVPCNGSSVQSDAQFAYKYANLPRSVHFKIPESVQSLDLYQAKTLKFDDFCLALPHLKHLTLYSSYDLNFSAQNTHKITSIVSLCLLHTCIPPTALANILTVCTSLHTLAVKSDPKALSIIPATTVSKSLKELLFENFGDNLENVLAHFPNIECLQVVNSTTVEASSEAISRFKYLFLQCNYTPEIWNAFKKVLVPCKAMAVRITGNYGSLFCLGEVHLVRKALEQRGLDDESLIFGHGLSLEYLLLDKEPNSGQLKLNLFVDPQAFEEAICRKYGLLSK